MLQLSSTARRLLFMGATAALAVPAAAQSTKTPKYSNEFLNIGVGARALGMGKVQVSLADNATAGYWNPAGLVNQTHKYDGVLMHSELFSGVVKNDYAAFSMPLDDKSAIGASVMRLGVDNIADTRNLINEYGYVDYSKIEFFSVADYALLLSYSRKLGNVEGLSLGANGKIIYRNIGKFAHGYGFGIDAGLQYNYKGWNLGLMARDITTTFTQWNINADEYQKGVSSTIANGNDPTPKNSAEITLPRFVLGAGRRFVLPKEFSALVAVDLEATTDGQRNTPISTRAVSVDPRIGMELGYKDLVFLRGGAGNYQKIQDFTANAGGTYGSSWKGQYSLGAGVAVSGLRIDLALSRLAVEKLGSASQTNSLIVSLGYGLK
ncbi:PorV/PorQ family protein [Hymenobacter sp. BT770]|uniref:putative type IX sorting system protein PorV2 n=1 Tax=Hymenobacter sp. BT770 TaxID=2886942 RepID=UPI001D0F5133|nr:PorV/PorQ family protein [Hymenobacter sp. BT770]MCC3153119.1 PorV/PorQ family protein [Hymenobacter sp. BT770]MDO3415407.1 PorV/PorQ family protein [Hymenobacter sp. BT770]